MYYIIIICDNTYVYIYIYTYIQNGPSWGSFFCSKNGQKHWYLQCFVTVMGLKPLFWSNNHSPMIMAGKNFIYTKLVKQGVEPGTQNKEPKSAEPCKHDKRTSWFCALEPYRWIAVVIP